MDRALLEELHNIIESNGDGITQKSTHRLLLASMVAVVTAINEIREKIDEMADTLGDQVGSVNAQAEEYANRFATKADLQKIETNYAIRAGKFVAEKPKTALLIFIFLVIAANTWFVSDFRHWLLALLGLPANLLPAQ